MNAFRLDQLLDALPPTRAVVAALWLGLAGLTVALVVMMRTRWGQSHQLRKCLILSLIAHLLFIGYATTVEIVTSVPRPPAEPVHVVIAENLQESEIPEARPTNRLRPWESFQHPSEIEPEPAELARVTPKPPPAAEKQPPPKLEPLLDQPPLAPVEPDSPAPAEPSLLPAAATAEPPSLPPEPIEVPAAQRQDRPLVQLPENPIPSRVAPHSPAPPEPSLPDPARSDPGQPWSLEAPSPLPAIRDAVVRPQADDALPGLTDLLTAPPAGERPAGPLEPEPHPTEPSQPTAGPPAAIPPHALERLAPPPPTLAQSDSHASHRPPPAPDPDSLVASLRPARRWEPAEIEPAYRVPDMYRFRMAPNRSKLAEQFGATPESEHAVEQALKWLAANQSSQGSWEAARHGAGRELLVAGRNRQQAGLRADTGMTGLALLALLGAGHTHRTGHYQNTVRKALEYLIKSQSPDGSLGGQATTFAFMYCHGMATLALSEALGMTGDERLRPAVQKAVAYTLAAQNPTTGGWRYVPGDPGDTSQLGWQVMALKSAELAGETFPVRSRNGAIRFLNSVSYGRLGGLSSYRPGQPVSRSMTAEALATRLFLGMAPDHPAASEAADYLLEELPGQGPANLYYWYYATLVMYQVGGQYWERWNDALQQTLIASQRKDGPLAGSWDPETVWGGYGGRVYSTALATLCLEVYYRFLPLYFRTSTDVAER